MTGGRVNALDFSPDGKLLAVGSSTLRLTESIYDPIQIWDIEPLIKAVDKELQVLVGQWKLVAVEDNVVIYPKDKLPPISITLRADGAVTVRTPNGEDQSNFHLDHGKDPKTIDIVDLTGRLFKDFKLYGIYKVEGDRWTVVVATPGARAADRPRDFNTKGGKGRLMVWERVKDDKKR
jgi:uncharacterized protein (TIGR03067 family)